MHMTPIDVLVLISGPVAVGKTSVRQALMSFHGFEYVRSSAYLIDFAGKQGFGIGRTELQNLGDELDRRTDYRWVVDEVARPAFAASPGQQRWLVDAVRKGRQIEHFRAAYGRAVVHVHLMAAESILSARYASRQSVGADTTSYEAAIQHENEIAARSLIRLADLVLDTGVLTAAQAANQIVATLAK